LYKIGFLRHYSGSRHARTSNNASKDADDHWIAAQGQSKLVKNSKTHPLSDVLPREPQTQNLNFFSFETKSVEGLNSSLAMAAGELWPKDNFMARALEDYDFDKAEWVHCTLFDR